MKAGERRTMDNDSDEDVHPLDQDYTQVVDTKRRLIQLPEGNVLRAGVICFVAGLFSAIVTALALGIFQGVRLLEMVGSYLHQGSMIMILVGGLFMLLGFKLNRGGIRNGSRAPVGSWKRLGSWRVILHLFAGNVVGSVLVFYLITSVVEWTSPRFASMSVYCVLVCCGVIAAMGILVHRGWWRGYCVGVFVAFLFFSANGVMASMLSYRGMRGFSGYRSTFDNPMVIFMCLVQFSGMVGAIYGNVFDGKKTGLNSDCEGGGDTPE